MNGLATIAHLNSVEDLKHYMKNNPLTELYQPEDIKQSPDYSGVDMKLLEKVTGREILDTYFVDSSGFGESGEAAMTFGRFMKIVEELIRNNSTPLYSCLTDVGQFQVYVTILI